HNHLSVNLAGALYERDTPPWRELIQRVRREVYAHAVRNEVSMIVTGVYAGRPESEQAWRTMLAPFFEAGTLVQFVQLACSRDQLLERVQRESRRAHDKLVDPVRLLELLETHGMDTATVPFTPHLRIDTTRLSARMAAEQIVADYGLERVN